MELDVAMAGRRQIHVLSTLRHVNHDGPVDLEPDSEADTMTDEAKHPIYPLFKMPARKIVKYLQSLETLLGSREKMANPQEGLWDSLPEEILWSILIRLPAVTQCRYRCICPKWNMLLSMPSPAKRPAEQLLSQLDSRASCTIMCNVKNVEDRFFCHGEGKWFPIPKPTWCEGFKWKLLASDGGLLCYGSGISGPEWLLIHNPVTGSYRVLGPHFPRENVLIFKCFIVDLETKSFKVMLTRLNMVAAMATVIFDSKTQEWKTFQSSEEAYPDVPLSESEVNFRFVWKNKLYQRVGLSATYLAFDLESGLWSKMDVHLPCLISDPFHIGCSRDLLLVSQADIFANDPIRIWKLDKMVDSPDLSTTRWERVPVTVPRRMRTILSEFRSCIARGHDYICFTMKSNYWMKYSLGTRKWSVMPNGGRLSSGVISDEFDWLNWKPQMDMDVDLGDFKEKEATLLAAALQESDDSDFQSSDGDSDTQSSDGTDEDD